MDQLRKLISGLSLLQRVSIVAMAALVMGLASQQLVKIDDGGFIATSFPGFVELMRSIGADLS